MIIKLLSYSFIPHLPFITLYSKEKLLTPTWLVYALEESLLPTREDEWMLMYIQGIKYSVQP